MAIIAGIDEAGYGPLLGPLVVTGVVFEVPDEQADRSLWDLLSDSVSRHVRQRDHRLPILDSKKLYRRREGIGLLERSALTAYQSAFPPPGTLVNLLSGVAPHVVADLNAYPWYRDFDVAVPHSATLTDISLRANAVRRDCREHGVTLKAVVGELLLEGHFNRLVNKTHNKAVVLLGLMFRIVQRILNASDGAAVRIFVDRQGGRSHYTHQLLSAFDAYRLRVLEESTRRSAYALSRDDFGHTIDFLTEGEDRRLPIALASIFSKYLRELFMIGVNRFWQERVQGLLPTAGYYRDARRFLSDIDPAVKRVGIDRNLLVRAR